MTTGEAKSGVASGGATRSTSPRAAVPYVALGQQRAERHFMFLRLRRFFYKHRQFHELRRAARRGDWVSAEILRNRKRWERERRDDARAGAVIHRRPVRSAFIAPTEMELSAVPDGWEEQYR